MAAAAGAATRPALVLGALVAALMMLGAEAVWLDLPPTGTKCVSEEIQPNVVVVADYMLMYEAHATAHPTVAVKCFVLEEPQLRFEPVTSPYGNTVHHKENATVGQFAFTTSEAGNYLACFWLDSAEKGSGVSLNLDWKIGIATKDWDSVAKKEKIEGVELELAKLEAAVESIHHNLLYLKARQVIYSTFCVFQ
uniref:Transmembrane emp24 domain-containing protein 10 n=1 Tax=Aegilops tauschii TaxID=37682 RepID=N1QSB9_AEGTA